MKVSCWTKLLLAVVTLLATALLVAGCEKSTEPTGTGQISMTSKYSSAPAPAASIRPDFAATGESAIDSIRITRARFVLRDIKFKTQADSSNFRALPMILELNLNGAVQEVSVASVPFGTYRRIEFDVHRVDTASVNGVPAAERPLYADFLAGDRYSIIIEGTIYTAGQAPRNFIYRSRVNAKQKIDLLPELVVSDGQTSVNVTMLISSNGWFKSGNTLLDPTDSRNESEIDNNLRASIRVYKDNNKDGSKDN